MICQRSTSAVVQIFTKTGYLVDVYLDDFYGAEISSRAQQAFDQLGDLFIQLGLDSSPEKDCPPATTIVCLGILVNTVMFTLEVPPARVTELRVWTTSSSFTKKQLQSLLGKLSFVTACVKPGRIFMARLLNRLQACNAASRHWYSITNDMHHFSPQFNRVSLIKPFLWDFQCFNFATDACLRSGGATCRLDCIRFIFPHDILSLSLHINALELFTIVVAVKYWAPQLRGSKFIVSSDNSTAVAVINSSASAEFMQRCLRQLWFTSVVFDFEVWAQHVPGRHNQLADYLSRWHSDVSACDKFHHLCSVLDLTLTFQEVAPSCFLFDVIIV